MWNGISRFFTTYVVGSGNSPTTPASASIGTTGFKSNEQILMAYRAKIQGGQPIQLTNFDWKTNTKKARVQDAMDARDKVADFGELARDTLLIAQALHISPLRSAAPIQLHYPTPAGTQVTSLSFTQFAQANIALVRDYMQTDLARDGEFKDKKFPAARKVGFFPIKLNCDSDAGYLRRATDSSGKNGRWNTTNDQTTKDYAVERYAYARAKFADQLSSKGQIAFTKIVSTDPKVYSLNLQILADLYQFNLLSPSAMFNIYQGAVAYANHTGDHSMAKICEWGLANSEYFPTVHPILEILKPQLEAERNRIISQLQSGVLPNKTSPAVPASPAAMPTIGTPNAANGSGIYSPIFDLKAFTDAGYIAQAEAAKKAVDERNADRPLTKDESIAIENLFRHNPGLIGGLIKGTTTFDDLRNVMNNPTQARALREVFSDKWEDTFQKWMGYTR